MDLQRNGLMMSNVMNDEGVFLKHRVCRYRAQILIMLRLLFTRLGAADSDQPCHYDGGMHGLLDADPAINPMMYNWNKVYIGYCDGASFGGNVPLGTYVDGPDGKQKIYYRGKMILDSAFDSLLTDRNMKAASDVLISGSSAGGLAVLQHIDYLNDKVGVRVRLKFITVHS